MRKNRSDVLLASIVAVMMITVAPMVMMGESQAAEPGEIEDSIALGLTWLADQQDDATGLWYYPSTDVNTDRGATGLALLKFVDRARELGYDPFGEGGGEVYEYAGVVQRGFEALTSMMTQDTTGIHFPDGRYDTYATSLALTVMSRTGRPDRVAMIGGTPMTYQQIVEGMAQHLVVSQNQNMGYVGHGGWSYNIADAADKADGSNTGYASLGLGMASAPAPTGFGIAIPATTLTLLDNYIDSTQYMRSSSPEYGGASYYPMVDTSMISEPIIINVLETGNMLYELALVGEAVDGPRVTRALAYISSHWAADGTPLRGGGWLDNTQAMFTMMKGLEAYGIDIIDVGGTSTDWFDEVSDHIVATQAIDGHWNCPSGFGNPETDTAWAMLTLERVVSTPTIEIIIDIKACSWPNAYNRNAKGVLPVTILGMEDFDVSQIDPTTILLYPSGTDPTMGASPMRWSLEDKISFCPCAPGTPTCCTRDGILDLGMKFSMPEVSSLIGEYNRRDVVSMTLSGELLDGTPFIGEDVLWIVR